MEIKLSKKEFDEPLTKLISGLVEAKDVSNFLVDRDNNCIQIMIGDWNVQLNSDKTWEIA